MKSLGSMCSAQNPLQVGPVDAEIGCAEPGAVGAVVRDRKRRDAAAVAPSAPDQFARFAGLDRDRLETAEAIEFRVALAESATAAPISRSSDACSYTSTSSPRRRRASASVKPPMPPPTTPMQIRGAVMEFRARLARPSRVSAQATMQEALSQIHSLARAFKFSETVPPVGVSVPARAQKLSPETSMVTLGRAPGQAIRSHLLGARSAWWIGARGSEPGGPWRRRRPWSRPPEWAGEGSASWEQILDKNRNKCITGYG